MIYVCEFTQNNWREGLAAASLQAGLVSASEVEALWQGNERVIRHRREHLSAWLLFLYALRAEYGITELSSLQLARHPHGKPYSVAHPELFFNLSHCQGACACVLADRPVGIDVERKLSYKETLMRRICTKDEQALFADCQNDTERADLLSVLWPMKESYVKRDGRGLSCRLNQVPCAAYLQEYRSDRRKNREQIVVQKNANQKQFTSVYCLKNAISKQDEIAMASEMCVFVYDAYTLAVCGCADAELVQVTEDMLYERSCDRK